MLKREDIVAAARRWLGVPFRHQGRSRQGIDCAGLIELVGVDLGLMSRLTPAQLRYARVPNPNQMRRSLESHLIEIEKDAWMTGDVLWLRVMNLPMHLAIATEHSMIHAYSHAGRVVENGFPSDLDDILESAWTWPHL